MSLDVEPKEEKTLMTLKEVVRKIEDHDGRGPVDLTNCIFEERIDLSNRTIPHSLNFRYSIFDNQLTFYSSVMKGSFIDLEGAELKSGVYFTGLKAERYAYGIILRKAKIFGAVVLNGAGPITNLQYYDNEHYGVNGVKYTRGAGDLMTDGADIERIILKGN